MNITARQIKDRLAEINWRLAGLGSLDELVDPLLDSTKAASEFDARSRVLGAWSLANLLVFSLSVVSGNHPWGMTAAVGLLGAGTIVALVRSRRACKALHRCQESAYEAIDDVADRFPRALPEPSTPGTAHGRTQE